MTELLIPLILIVAMTAIVATLNALSRYLDAKEDDKYQ